MSVLSYLQSVAASINIAENEATSIKRSTDAIHDRLGSYFGGDVKKRFTFGSSTRRTMLSRIADSQSDVDYMIIFDNSDSRKPQSFYNRLKKFAETYYSSSEIRQSAPTVVLELNHIKFDLVPGYENWMGIYIPSPSSSWADWMTTDPFSLNPRLDAANSSAQYHLRPAIRLSKYWNARNSHVYESFELESALTDMSYIWCNNLKEVFFRAMNNLPTWTLPDHKRNKVRRAQEIIERVRDYENKSMPATAEAELKKLLPEL